MTTKSKCARVDLGQAQNDLETAKRKYKATTNALTKAEDAYDCAKVELNAANEAFDNAVRSVKSS